MYGGLYSFGYDTHSIDAWTHAYCQCNIDMRI